MEQHSLFTEEQMPKTNDWQKEWVGMPEYNNEERKPPVITATFKFRSEEDFELFNKTIKEHLYNGEKPFDGMQRKDVKSTWFPLTEKANKYTYKDESEISDIHNK